MEKKMDGMKIITVSPGHAKVVHKEHTVGHVIKTDSGQWQARRTEDLLTVGKFFPEFKSRKQAAEFFSA